uniref:Uncharacterized protein n=1 Tax=Anopheles atroparvus TaxID=41427 RepID=A0A182J9W2_ANOAO
MELSFRYNCSCKERKKLTFNKLLDGDYQRRLNEYTNDIVDRVWDEQDTEILSLMSLDNCHWKIFIITSSVLEIRKICSRLTT